MVKCSGQCFLIFLHTVVSSLMQSNLIQTSTISEYDLGGEGDLFKAPEPIIEEPIVGLDPMTAAISMISCGEEVIPPQGLKVADIESIQSDPLLSEVFYECEKDFIEKAAIETPLAEILDIKIPIVSTNENHIQENKLLPDIPLPKSVSSESLNSMEWMHGAAVKPSFLELPGMDFGTVYGMRRAYSEGDIKVRLCYFVFFVVVFKIFNKYTLYHFCSSIFV